MNRLIVIAISAVVLLAAAILIGPSFVDWNKYKPEIVTQVKTASGYDVKIDGDISLSILPAPSLKIRNVSVANPKKMKAETLASIEEANVSVALMPLFSKKFEVQTIKLVKPDIRLEVLPDGTQGWMTDKLKTTSDATPAEIKAEGAKQANNAMDAIAFEKVTIEDGRFEYADFQSNKTQLVEDIDISFKAGSISGPYDGDGSFIYSGQKIKFDGEASKAKDGEMTVNAELGLPDANAKGIFAGVVAVGGPLDVQGEVNFEAAKLGAVAKVAGSNLSPAFDQKASIKGIVTAGPDSVSFTNMTFGFGDLNGKGTFALENMTTKNPVKFSGDLDLQGVFDFDKVAAASQGDKKVAEQTLANAGKEKQPATTGGQAGFLPQTLTLPFQADGEIRLNIAEVKTGGKSIKGLLLDVKKAGGTTRFDVKAMEIPGAGKIDGTGTLLFASSTVSPQNGSVTYSDPTLSFTAAGNATNLPELMRVAGQKEPVADLFKTAQFNLTGAVSPANVTLKDSTIKLDQTTIATNLIYSPAGAAGKADVNITATADTIDIDAIKAQMSGKKQIPAAAAEGAPAPSMKEAVKPLQDFSLPVNLTFDVSAVKARFNGADLSNVRLAGAGTGKSLNLNIATAQNLMGADVNARGRIDDLEKLTGIDVDVQAKSDNANAFLKSLNVDTSKMPQNIGALDATVSLKGAVDKLDFTANVKAMSGQLDATGNLVNVLDKPSVGGLTLGIKHPNFVQAMQIFNPAFKGSAGLEKPFDFYTQMVSEGKIYTLSGMKANFGPTSVSGDVKADMSGAKPNIVGTIQMGAMPLDSFLGANTSGGATSSAGGVTTTGATNTAQNSGSRWSRNAIETGWMQSANMDLTVNARSITYGGWDFQQPSTKITLKDGTLNVDNLNAGLFGGKAVLNSKVVAPADQKQPVTLTVKTSMTDVAVEPLVFAMSGSKKLQAQGTVSLDMDVGGSGVSPNALVSSLKGAANLNGKSIVIQGFDLAKLARGLATEEKLADSAMSLVNGALTGGSTQFDTVVGNYAITEGIVNITKMQMDGPSSVINSTGNVNLPAYTIDTKHAITLKNVTGLEPFNITLAGPLSNPKTVGANILEEYARKKIERKVVKELPKLLGDDVTNKLEKFGILPKANTGAATTATPSNNGGITTITPSAPTPVAPTTPQAQQPAAGDDTWADPSATPAPAPAPEPAAPATPEEAIKGVLDGLLQQ
jgi:uncharacterized protein involved in outer membrane biogenesis